jgi:hypothetical protein
MFRPFSRVVALYGTPFTVDPKLKGQAFESLRRTIETDLAAFDALADLLGSDRTK